MEKIQQKNKIESSSSFANLQFHSPGQKLSIFLALFLGIYVYVYKCIENTSMHIKCVSLNKWE